MQSPKEFLTRNWLAKLSSLLLATVLWMAIASETSSEMGITVQIQYQNIPGQFEVIDETANTVEVRLRGSANIMKELAPQEVAVSLNLAGMGAGESVLQLTAENVQAPFGVEVMRVNPSRVRINLDRSVSKIVPVKAHLLGQPETGSEVKEVSIIPNVVEIHGPESRLRHLEGVATEPVDIEGANGEVHRFIGLDVDDSFLRLQRPSAVDVRVGIGKKTPKGQ